MPLLGARPGLGALAAACWPGAASRCWSRRPSAVVGLRRRRAAAGAGARADGGRAWSLVAAAVAGAALRRAERSRAARWRGWPRDGRCVDARRHGHRATRGWCRAVRRPGAGRGSRPEVTGRGGVVVRARDPSWCSATPTGRRPAGSDGAVHRAARAGRRRRPGRACVAARAARAVAAPGRGGAPPPACGPSIRDSVAHRPTQPAGAGAGAGRRRRRRHDPGAGGRLPDDRSDPPAGGVGHQPDARRRLPAGARPLVRRARSLAVARGRGRASSASSCWPAPSRACSARRRWARSRCSRWAPAGGTAGLRGLGVAVVVLLLVDPGLAVTAGFALSVLATAGILLLAPVVARRAGPVAAALGGRGDRGARRPPSWPARRSSPRSRDRSAWSPSPPTCVVAPAVGPATVLGLAGGLVGLVCGPAGRLLGTAAGWCVGWIVAVAEHGAALPAAAVDWGTGRGRAGAAHCVVARGWWLAGAAGCCGAAATGPRPACCCWSCVLVGPPTPGLAAGGLGARRLRRRPGRRARAARRRRARRWSSTPGPTRARSTAASTGSGSSAVPLLVLTHFHADHVDGAAGRARRPARSARWRSPGCADPPAGRGAGRRRGAGRAWRRGRAVRRRRAGSATSPCRCSGRRPLAHVGPGDGSTANDASVVLLAEVARRPAPADRRRRAEPARRRWPERCPACRSTC